MSNVEFQSLSTKLQAYRLIHDPAQLFCLLYLKYGLTSEDFFISYINQIMYNDSCHYTLLYKELIYSITFEEFLKKMYTLDKSKDLISKINKHNQNYFKFFSKPIFNDFYFNKFIGDYYDNKAEIFYINDYSGKKNTKILKENELKNAINYNISSFDNDTRIDTIFNKRMKIMIDNNLESKDVTISLSSTKRVKENSSNKNISYESLKTIIDYLATKKSKMNGANGSKLDEKNNQESIKFEKNPNEIIKQINNQKLKLTIDEQNINNDKNIINQNLNNDENKINNKNPKIKNIENDNNKEKKEFNQTKIKENYIEINSPRIIYNKSQNLNNIKIFSPLYKKPKLKIKNKFEISKKSPSKNQLSILNTLKKSQNISKIHFYSPQNNKVKYIFNNLKSSISKKLESPESKKENSFLIIKSINLKSELPSLNKENSGKNYNNNSGLLLNDKKISPKKIPNINPLKNSNFKIFKKNQINKINTPRINLNKFSLDLRGINQAKKISNFSQDKIFDKNKNIISLNIEKKNFNYIKNNFLKKLRPSYSMNKEIESFNNDIKAIEINNKINKNLSRNSIFNHIKSNTKYILEGNKKRNINKHQKIIDPINLIKTRYQI